MESAIEAVLRGPTMAWQIIKVCWIRSSCAQRLRTTSTDRMENLKKTWSERRYDAGAIFGRLAVTHLALHDEWLGNISHGREAGVGEQLFGVHCAEVVQDEGA